MNTAPAQHSRICITSACAAFLLFALAPPCRTQAPASPAAPANAPAPQTPAAATDDDLVELPRYVIKESRMLPPPESWRHVIIPDMISELEYTRGKRTLVIQGFEVLSNLSAKNTGVFVHELQLRQVASAHFWPSLGVKRPGERPVIIIDSADNPWLSGDNPLPVEWENIAPLSLPPPPPPNSMLPILADPAASAPTDPFAETSTDDIVMTPALPDPNADAAPADLPIVDGVVDLHDGNGKICMKVRAGGQLNASRIPEERLAAMVNSKYARAKLASLRPAPPGWLQKGIGWLIESMSVSQSEIALGDRPMRVRRGGDSHLAPLKELFANYNDRDPDHVLTASAFVQFALYGDGTRYAAKFMQFAELACQGPVDEVAFAKTFGMSAAKMDRHLISFTSSTSILRKTGFGGKLPPMPETTIAEASQSDIARIKADLLQAEGKLPQALDELRIAYWRGERAPKLLAALGDLEQQIGDATRARKLLDAVMKLPAPPPRGIHAYARMRFAAAKAALPPGGKIPAAETQTLLAMCADVARQSAAHESLCALVADITLAGEAPPGARIAAFLQTALERFPENKSIQDALASLPRQDQ